MPINDDGMETNLDDMALPSSARVQDILDIRLKPPLLTLVTPQFARSGQFVCSLEKGCSRDYQTVDLIYTTWGKLGRLAVIDSPQLRPSIR